jgi:hypothetical protein
MTTNEISLKNLPLFFILATVVGCEEGINESNSRMITLPVHLREQMG